MADLVLRETRPVAAATVLLPNGFLAVEDPILAVVEEKALVLEAVAAKAAEVEAGMVVVLHQGIHFVETHHLGTLHQNRHHPAVLHLLAVL